MTLTVAICPGCNAIPAACTNTSENYEDIGRMVVYYLGEGYRIESREEAMVSRCRCREMQVEGGG